MRNSSIIRMLKACAIRNCNYSDLWETPSEVWDAVMPLFNDKVYFWEPFVGVSNRSTKTLRKHGHDVLETVEDFFEVVDAWPHHEEKPRFMLSNPPFSKKFLVLDKLMGQRKPFMLLVPSWVYASATVRKLIKKHNMDLQIVVPPKRVHYYSPEGVQIKKTAFDSVFIAYNVPVDKQIIYL